MVDRSRGEYHPNAKLTDEDVEQIRELIDWRKAEIARIQSIASNKAIADKFDVSIRTVESIGNFESRASKSRYLSYSPGHSIESKRKMSEAKLKKDSSKAGDYTRRTGIPAIDLIRAMAKTNTKTEVALFFGWPTATYLTGWLSVRGHEVEFKKHKPTPPRGKGFLSIERLPASPR